jgi:hypothetical protein
MRATGLTTVFNGSGRWQLSSALLCSSSWASCAIHCPPGTFLQSLARWKISTPSSRSWKDGWSLRRRSWLAMANSLTINDSANDVRNVSSATFQPCTFAIRRTDLLAC